MNAGAAQSPRIWSSPAVAAEGPVRSSPCRTRVWPLVLRSPARPQFPLKGERVSPETRTWQPFLSPCVKKGVVSRRAIGVDLGGLKECIN
jgi:hypothetical protein